MGWGCFEQITENFFQYQVTQKQEKFTLQDTF